MTTLDDILANVNGGWSNPIVNSITIPTGAVPGQTRIVIGGSIPPSLSPITVSDRAALIGTSLREAILFYWGNAGDDFHFIGTSDKSSATWNRIVLIGYATGTAAGSDVFISQLWEVDLTDSIGSLGLSGFVSVIDNDRGPAQFSLSNSKYWSGGNNSLPVIFTSFKAPDNSSHAATMPMGATPAMYLTAPFGPVAAETVITTWTGNANAGVYKVLPIYDGQRFAFKGQFNIYSTTNANTTTIVNVRYRTGGAINFLNDPIVASVKGRTGGLNDYATITLDQWVQNGVINLSVGDQSAAFFYVTLATSVGGNSNLFGTPDGSGQTCFYIEDKGIYV
jgi:hypothetical protein